MQMRFLILALVLGLGGAGSAWAADANPVIGDTCDTLGLTKMAANHGGILACLLTTASPSYDSCATSPGGCAWKSMGAASGTPVKVNYQDCSLGKTGGYNVAGTELGMNINTKKAAQHYCPSGYVMVGVNNEEVDSITCCKMVIQ